MQKRVAHTISSVIKDLTMRFEDANLYYGHGTENAYDEAAWLVLHSVGKPIDQDCDATEILTDEAWQAINTLAQARIDTNKPLAYLLQSSWFCGLEFYIDERALIPRSPIAELIFHRFSPWLQTEEDDIRILDMCTGSACIAVATAVYMPDVQVDACDISEDALAVAAINLQKHGVEESVTLYKSDQFQNLPATAKYDLIVCNPPYVDKEDMDGLPDEYRHEPELALASGDDGLDFVRLFLNQAKQYLHATGGIILEVGNSANAFDIAFPEIEKFWLEFEHGGDGVCFIAMNSL